MDVSQKSILDEIILELTKFSPTDETRYSEDYIYQKINQSRTEAIVASYKADGIIDNTWMQDLGMVSAHEVNFADDITLTSCECDISKIFIPQIVTLTAGSGNQDLGITVISSCGKNKYYPYQMSAWKSIPEDHERAMFNYFARINNALYISNQPGKVRIYGVLANPEDGKLIQSEPIISGSIVSGTAYRVKYGQVIYGGAAYTKDTTFTGGATTTFTGTGTVYLNSQVIDYRHTDPYPITSDMARKIVIDILVKEFGIEKTSIPDVKNDSKDDATKGQA